MSILSLKCVPNSTLKFQFQESRQKCIFSNLVWPPLIKGPNRSKSHKNRCQCLYLKWVSKSTLKFEFLENGKKYNVLGLGLTKFDRCPKWLAIAKKYTCMLYLPNGYLNTVSNFNFEKIKKSAFLRTWFDQP